MKVVHIATIDAGGAYAAALRISNSMQQQGIASNVLVRTKKQVDSPVEQVVYGVFPKLFSKLKNVFNLLLSTKQVQSDYFGTDITRNKHVKQADIIVLHWVNSFISYKSAERLAALHKPVIWVMHDMWLFTGGCHCDQYCGRYSVGCGNCPLLYKGSKHDISFRNFHYKQQMIEKLVPIIVGPSNWIISCAQSSEITKNCKIYRIPNPIDITVYQKMENKKALRDKYHISCNKKVILFSALHTVKNKNKGFRYFYEALDNLSSEYIAVVLGNDEDDIIRKEGKEIVCLGMIKEEQEMVEIYNMADVYVAPSDQDNYSNSVLEALACGIPGVTFAVGGMTDIISHKETGYIARYQDIGDLAEGIVYCAEHSKEMGEKAIEQRTQVNAMNIIGQAYADLCYGILNNPGTKAGE